MMCKSMAANKREGKGKQEKTAHGGEREETESWVYYTNEEKGALDQ